MAKKVVLITGSTSGIGKSLAHHLAKDGYKVLICSRSPAKVQETVKEIQDKGGDAEGYTLDVGDLSSVASFCDALTKSDTSVDALVLNAGVSLGDLRLSPQGIEQTFATNHLGHMLLTERLLSHFKASKLKRVLVVSSGTHDPASRSGVPSPVYDLKQWATPTTFAGPTVYSSSKLANVLYGLNLSKRYPDLVVSLYDPGFIGDTGLMSGTLGMWQPVVKVIINLMISVTAWRYGVPDQNSTLERTVPFMCQMVEKEEAPFNQSGNYYSIDHPATPSELGRDQEKQQELYEFSKQLLAEKGFPVD